MGRSRYRGDGGRQQQRQSRCVKYRQHCQRAEIRNSESVEEIASTRFLLSVVLPEIQEFESIRTPRLKKRTPFSVDQVIEKKTLPVARIQRVLNPTPRAVLLTSAQPVRAPQMPSTESPFVQTRNREPNCWRGVPLRGLRSRASPDPLSRTPLGEPALTLG